MMEGSGGSGGKPEFSRSGSGSMFLEVYMSFTKSFLLASSAALMGVSAVQAADLPSRKAAPVEYVRVCDAYGRGFFFIPGTDTCVRIGGLVRADYAYVASQDVFGETPRVAATLNASTGAPVAMVPAVPALSALGVPNRIVREDAQHTVGWEARARITFDARTQTSWGVVQTAARLRMARTTGVTGAGPDVNTATATSAGVTLEAAFIRFAGFTFGASRDNFSMMPSLTYGAGHWASFGNGAKQIAYTHSFGGGFSATIAVQDLVDTQTNAGVVDASVNGTARYVYNSLPNIVGRLDLEQGWGALSLAGAVAQVSAANNDQLIAANNYSEKKTVWAATVGATFNLPMLARGSKLYLTAAYADGMTEYTTNWTSFKSSAYQRDVGGFTMNHPSVVLEQTDGIGGSRIETVKSWNLAALLEHYWTPQYRSVLWGSYGQLDAPRTAAARAWNGTSGFGDAKVWNIGTNFAWLPTRDFEIGVEVIYARVEQNVRSGVAAGNGNVAFPGGALFRSSDGNVSGRLRVERSF